MNTNDIKTLYKLYNEFENEVDHAFNMMDNAGILDFRTNNLEKIELYDDPEFVHVIYSDYGYDLYDESSINIPTSILGNDEKIKEFIENIRKEQEEKERLKKEKSEKAKIEWERKEYERLKQQFEK